MIISNVNMIITEAGNFGVNTDIFETNVLNLSVVIGVLIYYGRVAFSIRFLIFLIKEICVAYIWFRAFV